MFRLLIAATSSVLLWSDATRASDDGLIEIYEYWGTYTLNAPPPDMKPIILQTPEASGMAAARVQGPQSPYLLSEFQQPGGARKRGFHSRLCRGLQRKDLGCDKL